VLFRSPHHTRAHSIRNGRRRRTVVVIGDVGVGNSTLAEKCAGLEGHHFSSDAALSFTSRSWIFVSPCGRLLLIDTPGANSMQDKLEHNMWIAAALNFSPVSLILLVVKAEQRIDNTVGLVRTFAERFQDFASALSVCVTHMDTVGWQAPLLLQCMHSELGMTSAMFVGKDTDGPTILMQILQLCVPPQDLSITSDNFLKFFKIHNSNLKILKSVGDEVAMFKTINRDFQEQLRIFSPQDKVDLVFEFHAYMNEAIYQSQQRVSETNSFTFLGDSSAN